MLRFKSKCCKTYSRDLRKTTYYGKIKILQNIYIFISVLPQVEDYNPMSSEYLQTQNYLQQEKRKNLSQQKKIGKIYGRKETLNTQERRGLNVYVFTLGSYGYDASVSIPLFLITYSKAWSIIPPLQPWLPSNKKKCKEEQIYLQRWKFYIK